MAKKNYERVKAYADEERRAGIVRLLSEAYVTHLKAVGKVRPQQDAMEDSPLKPRSYDFLS